MVASCLLSTGTKGPLKYSHTGIANMAATIASLPAQVRLVARIPNSSVRCNHCSTRLAGRERRLTPILTTSVGGQVCVDRSLNADYTFTDKIWTGGLARDHVQ